MAVMIRLARQGAKKRPQYLVVAIDSRKKRDGAYLEKLGYYFPQGETIDQKIRLNVPAIQAWIGKGAQFSETAGQLFKQAVKLAGAKGVTSEKASAGR